MKREHWLIIGLLAAGLGLFAVVQGVVLPQKALREAEYAQAQHDPTSHDLNRILPYKHPYMGNAANLGNLFDHLPLDHLERTYRLDPETLTADIRYKAASTHVDEETLHKALIYNAVAAFALIDNLENLRFNFYDCSYAVAREGIVSLFGRDLSALLTAETWKNDVQEPLKDRDFVNQALEAAFTIHGRSPRP